MTRRTRRGMRAPTAATIGIVLAAMVALAVLLLAEATGARRGDLAAAPAAPAAVSGGPGFDGVAVRAALTTNARERPSREAPVVVIIPPERVARVTGRSPSGDWLLVVYPPDSRLEGWVPAAAVMAVQGDAEAVAVLDVAEGSDDADPAPGAPATPTAEERLPDLTITNAFVAPNGTLTIRVANAGTGQFDGTFGLRVTSAEGEIVGVLDIQRTQLAAGRSATVSTRVEIASTGTYLMEIDWLDEVEESGEFNNALETLLVASG